MAQSRRRKRKGNGSLYTVVFMAIILLAAVTGMSVFFRVSEIVVEGNNAYSTQEILDAAGIEVDSSIFFLRESAAVVRIKEALPYVDDVRIVTTLPSTVTIEITESYPIASIEYDGSKWIIDNNARILEKLSTNDDDDVFPIYGVTPIMPAVGDTLSLGDSGTVQLLYLKQTLTGILGAGIYDEIQWLDMTNISSVTFMYMDKFTVNLGKGENLEEKLFLLSEVVLNHLDDGYTATIDLSTDGEAHYIRD